jgi:hypothetical protein
MQAIAIGRITSQASCTDNAAVSGASIQHNGCEMRTTLGSPAQPLLPTPAGGD